MAEEVVVWKGDSGQLIDALKVAVGFTSKDEARPAVRSVCIDRMRDQVYVLATDSYRMICKRLGAGDGKADRFPGPAMIDRDNASGLVKLLRPGMDVELVRTDSHLRVRMNGNGEILPIPLVPLEYVPWKTLFMGEHTTAGSLVIDRLEMYDLLHHAKSIRAESVRFDMEPASVVIRYNGPGPKRKVFDPDRGGMVAAPDEAESHERVLAGARFWPEDGRETASFGANVRYLLSALDATEASVFTVANTISSNGLSKPLRFNGDDCNVLVMPIGKLTPDEYQPRTAPKAKRGGGRRAAADT